MSVGSDLRQMRESKRITLEQVAQKTKISQKYLEAIESDQYDVFPSHTYAKGFLRAYAKIVGADPLLITRQFEEEVEPRPVHIQPTIETPVPRGHSLFEKRKMPDNTPQPTPQDFLISFDDEEAPVEEEKVPLKTEPFLRRDKSLVPPWAWKQAALRAAIVLLVLGGLYAVWAFFRAHPIHFARPQASKTAAEPVPTTAAVTPPVTPEVKPAKKAAPPVPTPTATVVEKKAEPEKPPPAKKADKEKAVEEKVTRVSAPPPVILAADKYHHVILKGREDSWVLVGMDGEKTWEFILDRGETKSFKARKYFTVKVGNAAGVDLWFDGEAQEILGGRGQVMEIRLPKEGK